MADRANLSCLCNSSTEYKLLMRNMVKKYINKIFGFQKKNLQKAARNARQLY